MELEYQWEVVEDEISDVFDKLLESTTQVLVDLREAILGKLLLKAVSWSSNIL
jgi:hypothetical protein